MATQKVLTRLHRLPGRAGLLRRLSDGIADGIVVHHCEHLFLDQLFRFLEIRQGSFGRVGRPQDGVVHLDRARQVPLQCLGSTLQLSFPWNQQKKKRRN